MLAETNLRPIFIIGFMGAGKTTFGKKLATQLKRSFIDIDEAIITRYQQQDAEVRSIAKLIEQKGLPFFRTFESETLQSLSLSHQVVATGGGTPCFFDNLAWMKRRGAVVYLAIPEGVLLSRLKTTNLHERPLLSGKSENELKNFIKNELEQRLPFYQQAHLCFNPLRQPMSELIELLRSEDF